MRTLYFISCMICILLTSACEKSEMDASSIVLEGAYTGQASILIQENRIGFNRPDTTLTLLDTLVSDVITVSPTNNSDTIFNVDRASDFFSSFYDFEGKRTFDSYYRYFINYSYDKYWKTELQLFPEKDSIIANMIVSDIFESFEEDEFGNLLYTYRISREYSFEGRR